MERVQDPTASPQSLSLISVACLGLILLSAGPLISTFHYLGFGAGSGVSSTANGC